MRRLRGLRFVGMDLVEVCPAYDVAEITAAGRRDNCVGLCRPTGHCRPCVTGPHVVRITERPNKIAAHGICGN
jgi:hypothetical protein